MTGASNSTFLDLGLLGVRCAPNGAATIVWLPGAVSGDLTSTDPAPSQRTTVTIRFDKHAPKEREWLSVETDWLTALVVDDPNETEWFARQARAGTKVALRSVIHGKTYTKVFSLMGFTRAANAGGCKTDQTAIPNSTASQDRGVAPDTRRRDDVVRFIEQFRQSEIDKLRDSLGAFDSDFAGGEDEQEPLETERQAEEARKSQAEREAQMRGQLEAEERQRQVQAAMNQHIPAIRRRVTQSWLRPSGVPEGLEVTMRVQMAAAGMVRNVSVVDSSGNGAFDNSAIRAVEKASPLPVPSDPDIARQFRDITFVFKPDE
ncbi:cell envelope integrity protein TolA [Ectothiorhodospiraceae bacterium WFHF3C12]|nr:cell envelope integrity protein TolA [Ectothiorhodospiraceae bacterium WFHF3C12]